MASEITTLRIAMTTRKVSQKEILQDIRSGMDEVVICKKYQISLRGLQKVYDKLNEAGLLGKDLMPVPKKINLLEVLADVRRGMNKSDLMNKYKLSEDMVRQVSKKLLVAEGKRSATVAAETVIMNRDEMTTGLILRHQLDFDVAAYDPDRPEIHGLVRDVSRESISLAGLEVKEGETKTLVVLGDEMGQFSSFEFAGCCRWSFVDPDQGTLLSGFSIDKISTADAQELSKLVRLITAGG